MELENYANLPDCTRAVAKNNNLYAGTPRPSKYLKLKFVGRLQRCEREVAQLDGSEIFASENGAVFRYHDEVSDDVLLALASAGSLLARSRLREFEEAARKEALYVGALVETRLGREGYTCENIVRYTYEWHGRDRKLYFRGRWFVPVEDEMLIPIQGRGSVVSRHIDMRLVSKGRYLNAKLKPVPDTIATEGESGIGPALMSPR